MRFLRPEWLHLLWLAAPILAFYLVRRRTRPQEVSSLLLWEKVLASELRRPLWGRLRETVSLLLNLLLLAGLAVAAAGPERVVAGPRTETWAVVVSAGATMRAEATAGRSRFEVACAQARAIVARQAPGDRAVLVRAGESPTLLGDLSDAGPGVGPADLPAALAFARAAAGGAPDRVFVVGDRDPGDPGAIFLSVAEAELPNAGFTEVDARRDPVRLTTTVRVRVENAGPGEARREVALRGPGGHEARRVVAVAEGAARDVAFTFSPRTAGRAEIRLEPGDAYARDDRVTVPVEPPPRLRLLVVGALDSFLESALRAQGDRVDRERSARVALDALPEVIPPDAVLVLVGQDLPERVRAGNVWILDDPAGPVREAPAITGWASDHPILRDLDLGNLGLRRGRPVAADEDETSLLAVEGGAAITASETEDLRVLRVRFALGESNLPVLAAFPLLVRNTLAWFAGVEERLFPAAIRQGQLLEPRVRLPDGIDRVHLSGPSVSGVREVAVRDGRIAWRPARAPARADASDGALVVRVGTRSETVAVNPITPHVPALPAATAGARIEDLPRRLFRPPPSRDLLPWVLGLLAALLLLEWWQHHRGRRTHFG